MTRQSNLKFCDTRHPDYQLASTEWSEWRETFRGGQDYLDLYLQKFSDRETTADFNVRASYAPIPTFAKAAILDIRNNIFQRLGEVSRIGGTTKYHKATQGEDAGVDRNGSSMSSFMGIDVLTELLVMGRTGIFVDAPSKVPTTLAEEVRSPYLYSYQVEDILSWSLDEQAEDGTFRAVLLRDHVIECSHDDSGIDLPNGREERYRLVWKDFDGVVRCKFFDSQKEVMFFPDSGPDGAIELGIKVVPFIMPNIGGSLLADVASYQKALLNLASGDVNWALKSNIPFLTIQEEMRTAGSHLKTTAEDATTGGQPAQDKTEAVGGTGRYYSVGMDRPDFIAPPVAPLMASLALQEKLEDDIRKLINLAVTNKSGSRTESAEAKKLSSQGLEAGLSYIGMVLQQAEQAVARYWAMYENVSKPEVATISYPKRYILKDDQERLDEAKALLEIRDMLPGIELKKTITREIVAQLMIGKESVETIEKLNKEVDSAKYVLSDVEGVIAAHEAGMVSDKTASESLGYDKAEYKQAAKDHAERAVRILKAQTSAMPNQAPKAPGAAPGAPGQGPPKPGAPKVGAKNPASRGVPALDTDTASGEKEQKKNG